LRGRTGEKTLLNHTNEWVHFLKRGKQLEEINIGNCAQLPPLKLRDSSSSRILRSGVTVESSTVLLLLLLCLPLIVLLLLLTHKCKAHNTLGRKQV